MFVRFVAPVAVKLPVLPPNCSPVVAPLIVTAPAVTAALELTRTRPVVAALVTLTLPRFTPPVMVSRLMPLVALPLEESVLKVLPAAIVPVVRLRAAAPAAEDEAVATPSG